MSKRLSLYTVVAALGLLVGVLAGAATNPDDADSATETVDDRPGEAESPDHGDPPDATVAPPPTASVEVHSDDANDDVEVADEPPPRPTLDRAAVRAALAPALVPLEGAACGGARQATGVQVEGHIITASPLEHYAGQLFAGPLRLSRWADLGSGAVAYESPTTATVSVGPGDVETGDDVFLVGLEQEIEGEVIAVNGDHVEVAMDSSVDFSMLGAPLGLGDGTGPIMIATSTGSASISARIVAEDVLDGIAAQDGPPPCADMSVPHPLTPDDWQVLGIEANKAAMIVQRFEDAIVANDYDIARSIDVNTIMDGHLEDLGEYGSNQGATILYADKSSIASGAWVFGMASWELIDGNIYTIRWCIRWTVNTSAGRLDQTGANRLIVTDRPKDPDPGETRVFEPGTLSGRQDPTELWDWVYAECPRHL